jgi:hypothetical protein
MKKQILSLLATGSHFTPPLCKSIVCLAALLLGASLAGCNFALPDLGTIELPSLPGAATEPPAPTATEPPTPTQVPSTCTNKYWPVALGATWAYEMSLEGHTGRVGTATDRIIDIQVEDGLTHFSVLRSLEYERYDSRSFITDYYCAADGSIFSELAATEMHPAMTSIELPALSDWVPQAAWDYGDGSMKLQFTQFTNVTVPAGSFDCGQFSWIPDGSSTACWAEGVGLVQQTGAGPMDLKSYTIP